MERSLFRRDLDSTRVRSEPDCNLEDDAAEPKTGGEGGEVWVGMVVGFQVAVGINEGEADDTVWSGPAHIAAVCVGGWVDGWLGEWVDD